MNSKCVIFYVRDPAGQRFRNVVNVAQYYDAAMLFCRHRMWDIAIINGESVEHFDYDDPKIYSAVAELFGKE